MVSLEKMTSLHLESVIKLSLGEDQIDFVGSIDDILTNINAQIRPHVIIAKEQVVGFFLIDTVYQKTNDFASLQSLGLRKFFVDTNHQGKGYAKQTLLLFPQYLSATYSNFNAVYLTVNCKNTTAKNVYLHCGFQDTNELYYGGEFGPQHVMKLELQG